LKDAGLDRLNISLDSLRHDTAGKLNGRGYGPDRVLGAIDAAAAMGFGVKVNMVVQRGVNDGEIVEMAAHFRERGHTLRFIEFMDVGTHNHWDRSGVLPSKEIVERIAAKWPLEPAGPNYRGEVASRYRYTDGRGEIGLISSVTEPFCSDCHRARLSADGRLFTCLFAAAGHDILGLLRSGATDEALRDFVAGIWGRRKDRYSDERAGILARHEVREKVEMSYIGG
jgi:cyclic pyranopterin phosphate synthase